MRLLSVTHNKHFNSLSLLSISFPLSCEFTLNKASQNIDKLYIYFEKTKGKFVISYTSPNATLGPYRANNYLYNYFEITIESTRKWLWFCFSSIRDWSRYLAPSSEPIRYKTKNQWQLSQSGFPVILAFTFVLLGRCDYPGVGAS